MAAGSAATEHAQQNNGDIPRPSDAQIFLSLARSSVYNKCWKRVVRISPQISVWRCAMLSTDGAFAAKTSEGKVVTWGRASWGGNSASVQAQLTQVLHLSSSRHTFTATLRDGSEVTWPGQ